MQSNYSHSTTVYLLRTGGKTRGKWKQGQRQETGKGVVIEEEEKKAYNAGVNVRAVPFPPNISPPLCDIHVHGAQKGQRQTCRSELD